MRRKNGGQQYGKRAKRGVIRRGNKGRKRGCEDGREMRKKREEDRKIRGDLSSAPSFYQYWLPPWIMHKISKPACILSFVFDTQVGLIQEHFVNRC